MLESKPKQERHWSFDLTPEDIAGIFMSKGWRYDKFQRPVLPDDVTKMIEKSVNLLVVTGKGYAELGRFVIWKDVEFPNGYEIAMKIGYVSVMDEGTDMDEPDCDCGNDAE